MTPYGSLLDQIELKGEPSKTISGSKYVTELTLQFSLANSQTVCLILLSNEIIPESGAALAIHDVSCPGSFLFGLVTKETTSECERSCYSCNICN